MWLYSLAIFDSFDEGRIVEFWVVCLWWWHFTFEVFQNGHGGFGEMVQSVDCLVLSDLVAKGGKAIVLQHLVQQFLCKFRAFCTGKMCLTVF